MRKHASHELIAFCILAFLTVGNMAYILLPKTEAPQNILAENVSNEIVSSINQDSTFDDAQNGGASVLSKNDMVGVMSPMSKGADKGSMLLQSDFAILFSQKTSLRLVEEEWQRLNESFGDAMQGLTPLARVTDTPDEGSISVRLAIGPFPNIQDAAYLCVSLKRQGETCEVSGFSGQPLDIFGQSILNSQVNAQVQKTQ